MILGHGRFFGDYERRRETDGVILASLVPWLPEREVERHTHADAHFVYVLGGMYLSSAAGAPEVAAAPTLVYNPPGTTHRDRFLSARGRFFTVSLDHARLAFAEGEGGLPGQAVWLGRPAALSAVARLACECLAWDTTSPLVVEGLLWTLTEATAGAPGPGPERALAPSRARPAARRLRAAAPARRAGGGRRCPPGSLDAQLPPRLRLHAR
jgi:AraC family transcriptional regulator